MIYRANILGISLVRKKTRQRFLICYWAAVFLLLLVPDMFPAAVLRPTLQNFLIVVAIGIPLLWITIRLLGLRAGTGITRDFEDKYATTGEGDYPPIDEREGAIRDHAHYLALRFIRIACVIAAFGGGLISVNLSSRIKEDAYFVLFLLMWLLPQTIVLWTEPDMEEQP